MGEHYTRASSQAQGTTTKASGKAESRSRVNGFRLHDIQALIEGRHGFYCTDPTWAERYFFAALPHVIVSRSRWLDAVRAWVASYVPVLLTARGSAWIDEEARRCHAKARKTPRTDKLSRLLAVTQQDWDDFKLCTISPVTKPKKVRDAVAREHRNAAKQAKRALDPNHTPRSRSKAALARAEGTTDDAIRAKARRARLKAEARDGDVDPTVEAMGDRVSCPSHQAQEVSSDTGNDRVSGPSQEAIRAGGNRQNDRVSGPTIRIEARPGFGPDNNTYPGLTAPSFKGEHQTRAA